MKKLFTILTVVILTTTISFAQSGVVAIGVNSNLADVAWQNYSLQPVVGYFVSDAIMVGTGFAMGTSSETGQNGEDLSTYDLSGFTISPFVRFYLTEALYASAGIAIGSGSSSDKEFDDLGPAGDGDGDVELDEWQNVDISGSTFGLNIGIGYSLMWNDRICIEPSLGMITASGSATETTTYGDGADAFIYTGDAPTTFDMGIMLGIHIRLGGDE